MSGDEFSDWAFTQDEIEAGIPDFLRREAYEARASGRKAFQEKYALQKEEEALQKEEEALQKEEKSLGKKAVALQREAVALQKELVLRAKKRKEITKLIAGLDDKVQIQNRVIKKLFHDNLDEMIFEYYIEEKVSSFEYIKLAKQRNCLKILISGYLKRHGGYTLTEEIIDEIDEFSDGILRNDDLEIAYQRVHRVQKFIHNKIDHKHGKNSHLTLPVKQIKDLLSTARLHLNIQDFTYRDVNSLAYIINQSNQQAETEIKYPAKIAVPKGKRYNKRWRVGHIQAIIFKPIESKIDNILKLDKELTTDNFKKWIIYICARN